MIWFLVPSYQRNDVSLSRELILSLYLLQSERYMVTYNPSKDKIYALLKDQAKSDDILKAAYHVLPSFKFFHSLFTTLLGAFVIGL